MKNKSFTLIELLVVISIIGLISSIVLVSMKGYGEKARMAKAKQFSSSVQHALGSEAVGIWRFEKGSGITAFDESGFGNDGELKNFSAPPIPSSGWTTDGIYGNTLVFDGDNDYVEIPDSPSLNITDAITIEAWVKTTDQAKRNPIASRNFGWLIYAPAQDGNLLFYANDGTDIASLVYAWQSEWNNNWIHIVGVYRKYTGDWTAKGYVNGELVGTNTNSAFDGMGSTGLDTNIGRLGAYYFNGTIDEVRIYDTALSTAEIQKHYAEGAVRHGIALK